MGFIAAILLALSPPIGQADTLLYFNEVNGLIIAEIESVKPAAGWTEKTDRSGFSGTSFFEWTSDNFFIFFRSPGRGVNEYVIKVNDSGTYRFQWRCKVGHGYKTTEANDSWIKIPDATKFYAIGRNGEGTIRPKGVCTNDCPNGSGASGWFKL